MPHSPPGRRRPAALAILAGAALATHVGVAAASVQLLVPAYYDPTGDTLANWTQLTDAAASGASITVIMNPSSGPGKKQMSDYTSAIAAFQAAGGKVIGYVPTDYDADSTATVEAEINDYLSWYPTINGIFLDEMAGDGTSAEISYYGDLYTYVKGISSSLEVIGNPGENVSKKYAAVADTIVTYENPNTGYSSQQADAWTASEPASLFANIVYGVPDTTTMLTDLAQAQSQNVGFVYFTDDSGDNPYDTLPSYFSAEVAAAAPEPAGFFVAALSIAPLLLRRSRQWQEPRPNR